eukprot:TRINITY_DN68949_c0_g1_i1.p1 TRINITY_DN68949_c0_g1~~TRINITY_DN68949_c0_g1_i1.p1  ORF type:complete len:215 (+),score=51.17 TRINITY_DN68949_c0_g1_i1:102-746(+)
MVQEGDSAAAAATNEAPRRRGGARNKARSAPGKGNGKKGQKGAFPMGGMTGMSGWPYPVPGGKQQLDVNNLFQSAAMAQHAAAQTFTHDTFMGDWADSLGNKVHVASIEAFQANLQATLSRPPRPDIHLPISQVPAWPGAQWQCGTYVLDPYWSTVNELHWVAPDGRISVWLHPAEDEKEGEETTGKGKGESIAETAASSAEAKTDGDDKKATS